VAIWKALFMLYRLGVYSASLEHFLRNVSAKKGATKLSVASKSSRQPDFQSRGSNWTIIRYNNRSNCLLKLYQFSSRNVVSVAFAPCSNFANPRHPSALMLLPSKSRDIKCLGKLFLSISIDSIPHVLQLSFFIGLSRNARNSKLNPSDCKLLPWRSKVIRLFVFCKN